MCVDKQHYFYNDASGRRLPVSRACGVCWQCRKNKVSDLVGRCLAEKSASAWCAMVTLTYRDSADREYDGAHVYLITAHLQNYVRSLRKRGHSIRYLGVGEYGSRNRRAHWHCLVFGQDACDQGEVLAALSAAWPYGFTQVIWDPGRGGMIYAVKYLLKPSELTESRKPLLMSKKPPLGHDFFMAEADRYVAAKVLPIRFEYRPPGGDERATYIMTGATRRNFLARICEGLGLWPVQAMERGNEWVQLAAEKVEKWLVEREDEVFTVGELDQRFKRALDRYRVVPYRDPYSGLED